MKIKEINSVQEKIYEFNVNGLSVHYIPKKDFSNSVAMLTSKFGGKDVEFSINGGESFKKYPEGIAHFLEHKMFEMPSEINVFNEFSKLGASVNAFTSSSQTSYYFETTENFYDNLKLLMDMVFTPHLTDENVAKEKGIITEEIRMYDDNPGFQGYIETMKALYKENPIREDVAGSVESINSLTKEDLLDCYNAFYNPSNMLLVISGDLDLNLIENIIKEKTPAKKDINLVKKSYNEKEESYKKNINLDMNLNVPNYIYAFKYNVQGENLLRESIAASLMTSLIFSESSSFYEDKLKSGEINDSFSQSITVENDHSEILFGGESMDPEHTISVIENYIFSMKNNTSFFNGLARELERIKKSKTGSFVNIFNSTSSITNILTRFLVGEKDLNMYMEEIKNIDILDIEKVYDNMFNKKSASKIIIK
ncbi:MAG: insulinase family protein [Clostridium sp.]|nr:insulinase family protein [Clostridium sp.]